MPAKNPARPVALAGAVALVLLLAACGGRSDDPADEIRGIAIDFVEALVEGNNAEACALTPDPEECLGVLALHMAFAEESEGSIQDRVERLLPDDWREQILSADVTFTGEDRAQMAPIAGDDEPTKFVREDGEWRVVAVGEW